MTVKIKIEPITGFRPKMKEYSFQSQKRAEWACYEARALLRSQFPFYDFDPAEVIKVKGKVLIAPAGFPIQLN